jgi:membrane-bound inhibitor of C-type lysozyme
MKTRTIIWILIVIVILGIIVAGWQYHTILKSAGISGAGNAPSASAYYACNAGKTITADFYNGTTTPPIVPGQPPVPTGSASIVLSDGRSMTLKQTISADGVRYANSDESFVFWTKGNGALVLENNQQQTYIGCVEVKSDPGGLPQVYQSGTEGFSIRFPAGYTVDDSYVYQSLGPGKGIYGTKFTIPASLAQGTNLGSDSYVSVESIPQAQTCDASLFVQSGAKVHTVTDSGTDYSVASTSDAGAGNRYEETVYAIPGTNPCIAIRYFIHYSAIENYPPGQVQAFDEAALMSQFDQIRRTLTLSQ